MPSEASRSAALPFALAALLVLGCGTKEDPTSETAETPSDSGQDGLIGEWGACEDYPAGERTCDELCANIDSVCVPRGCDGYTVIKYVMPSCASSGSYDQKHDYDCDYVFDVTTSSSSSAECCCL